MPGFAASPRTPASSSAAKIPTVCFLAVNGEQTLSHSYGCGLNDMEVLLKAGVPSFRLSPHSCDMVAVARLFRNALDDARDGRLDSDAAGRALERLMPEAEFSNGFLAGRPGAEFVPRGRPDS